MVRINLLPVRVSKKKEAGKQQLVLFVLVLIAGIVGNVLWTSNRASELKAKRAILAKTRADVARLDQIIGEVTSLKLQQQELQQKLDVLDKLKKGRVGPVQMLDELAQITPKRLWLRKLDEKEGKINFEGTASSNYDVSGFIEGLKGSRFFSAVDLKKVTSRADGAYHVVDFSLSANVQFAAPAQAAADAKGAPKAGESPAPKAGG
jgi:type IV pilus assembly protein PilN